MQIKYFQTAWGDIKHSKGWFGKICLLALIGFVPIFGQIVMFGYLYGWAREMAWGVHEPLPQRIFDDGDGKFWRRGWFVFVTTFVFALVPSVVLSIGSGMMNVLFFSAAASQGASAGWVFGTLGSIIYLAGWVISLLASILAWVGCMRVSIYDRLSAGFQLGKIWKMFRHDTGGILKIFGMNLLVSLLIGIILSVIIGIFMAVLFAVGAAGIAASGVTMSSLDSMSDAQAVALILQLVASVGLVGLFLLLVFTYIAQVATTFVSMLVVRAVGYWTMQFDVPRWRGQDDPMPFEGYGSPSMQ